MNVEDIARVTPGRLLMRVKLESEHIGQTGIVRPDAARSYLPVGQVLQVGEDLEGFRVGEWYYISQYAGQVISMEGVSGDSNEARLICSPIDTLARIRPSGEPLLEELFADKPKLHMGGGTGMP